MGFYTYPGGHEPNAPANMDSLSQLYISIAVIWTLSLAGGIAFLLFNRKLPALRMRRIEVGITAVCMLHCYWFICMLGYTMNGKAPCVAEFWIMSIYFPLGIALFQLNSTYLYHTVGLQERITKNDFHISEKAFAKPRGYRGLIWKVKGMDAIQRATWGIGAGIVIQTLLTIIIYLVSRQFHGSWGVTGSETTVMKCLTGWQWAPSIVWQLVWTWFYAPYMIWKTRGVNDVHGWRVQTIICSIASMPGAPLWTIALYSSAFANINTYWLPHNWLVPGITVMEFCLIFIPCWNVVKTHKLKQQTLEILSDWEKKQNQATYGSAKSLDSGSTYADSSNNTVNSGSTAVGTIDVKSGRRSSDMYTMQALEKALAVNPTPLLLFAALKDFSGENISFLTHVREWKEKFDPTTNKRASRRSGVPGIDRDGFQNLRRRQFNLAVEIYSSFVSLKYSDFPINLPSALYKELEAMFDGPASLINSAVEQDNSAIPFATWDDPESQSTSDAKMDTNPILGVLSETSYRLFTQGNRLPDNIEIPEAFGLSIFDKSEHSIKYMVLTNTWPKFVAAGFEEASRTASDNEEKSIQRTLKESMNRFFNRVPDRRSYTQRV